MSQENFYQTAQLQQEYIDRAMMAFELKQAGIQLSTALEDMLNFFCDDEQWIGVSIADNANQALENFYELIHKWS